MTSEEIQRSGPRRHIIGIDSEQGKEVAEWLQAIKEDGADIDEAVERLKDCKPSTGTAHHTGEPIQ